MSDSGSLSLSEQLNASRNVSKNNFHCLWSLPWTSRLILVRASHFLQLVLFQTSHSDKELFSGKVEGESSMFVWMLDLNHAEVIGKWTTF